MEKQWTTSQQQVIDHRSPNLLVSAAAGSGKTAVLVERILALVTDPEKPADIDRLLVVTFTNAAAAEMRERVLAAMEKRLESHPDDEHLQRQSAVMHEAMITTIHSFCLDVIRNYVYLLDLDPAFRVAEEGEIRLLRRDVLEELLEEEYGRGTGSFLRLADSLSPGRNDDGLVKIIAQLYTFSRAYPWPREWEQMCLSLYSVRTVQELNGSDWMKKLLSDVRVMAGDLCLRMEKACALSGEPDGPASYLPALSEELDRLRLLERAGDYEACRRAVRNASCWGRLKAVRSAQVDPDKKEMVKTLRDSVKADVKKLEETFFACSLEDHLEIIGLCRENAEELIRLVECFGDLFTAAKRERGIVDFNDLEQLALQVLIKEENGEKVPTEAARAYRERFAWVMTDEYQDSNLVQEVILSAVSREDNRFMVGDVKQSIYRFRQARPDLFLEKARSYAQAGTETGKEAGQEDRVSGIRIELHQNFRSRKQILSGVNMLFRQMMARDIGGVDYDDAAALYPGAEYPETGSDESLLPECLLAMPEDDSLSAEDSVKEEARMAAGRIRALKGVFPVSDGAGGYRSARYGDMVILLRSAAGWGEIFADVLTENGIPAFLATGTGYFSAPEVQLMLAFLQILDNPRQDIPLAAVLRSPIGDLSDEELAGIRAACPEGDFFEACEAYRNGENAGDPAGRKLETFFTLLGQLREESVRLPIHRLIWRILDLTGYDDLVLAMPGGSSRKANLEMLIQKAMAYEQGSYKGLFHFLRYIENLQKYEVDFAQAPEYGENADAVRIMTIHRSKGLEFPIVFVCGMGKAFNQTDSSSPVVLHPVLGMGIRCMQTKLRVRLNVLLRDVLAHSIREENLGEELRILYVAMTRAREKLILTGTVKKEDALRRWFLAGDDKRRILPYSVRSKAGSYLDLIMPALFRHRCSDAFLEEMGMASDPLHPSREDGWGFDLHPVRAGGSHPLLKQSGEQPTKRLKAEDLQTGEEKVYDPVLQERMKEALRLGQWQAPLRVPVKVSVSDLKSGKYDEDILPEEVLWPENGTAALSVETPESHAAGLSGAQLGTLYHRVMELLDYTSPEYDRPDFVQRQLESMVKYGKIQKGESKAVSAEVIGTFLTSAAGQRFRLAALRHSLYRETPFVMGVQAGELRAEWDGGGTVLVQGIIDAWFEEGDSLVLLDYKTDRVSSPDGSELAEKYHRQLELYEKALTGLTGKKVKEKLIYAFALGREIKI